MFCSCLSKQLEQLNLPSRNSVSNVSVRFGPLAATVCTHLAPNDWLIILSVEYKNYTRKITQTLYLSPCISRLSSFFLLFWPPIPFISPTIPLSLFFLLFSFLFFLPQISLLLSSSAVCTEELLLLTFLHADPPIRRRFSQAQEPGLTNETAGRGGTCSVHSQPTTHSEKTITGR